ncbi:MAG: trypsin-like serine protease [Oligoflexales bacterium]|nr:trypsin-like serine protease [Oligoflexales bacterium]
MINFLSRSSVTRIGSSFKRRRLGAAVLVFAAAACGQAPEQNASETKIYGGKKSDPGTWMGAVALTTGNKMYCSGTAVSPELVITAAHCIQGFNASSIKVYVGDGGNNGKIKGQHSVKVAKVNPQWRGNGEYDVGYLILSQPLDLAEKDFIPILLDRNEIQELVQIDKPSFLVGFGIRSQWFLGLFAKMGEKYEVTTPITKVTNTEVHIGGDGKDSCQGDSGGPAYGQLANGEWRVYGVVSRGGRCGSGGIWGLMHKSICWMSKDSGFNFGMPEGYCG